MLLETILKAIAKKSSKKAVAKRPDEDFFPYVCHYDPSTILTKNGELLQIIRVTGFGKNTISSDIISLREALRDSISEHVKDTKFAFWFHTIRRKKNIAAKGEYPDFFSQQINEEWNKQNNWQNQYVNELYITIITEGVDTSIHNWRAFLSSFSRKATFGLHVKFLENSYNQLSELSLKILADIEGYGAKLLQIAEHEGEFFSEPMRFFGKIANLTQDHYPLVANDISDELSNSKIAFGNREIEIINKNEKIFGAILTIKEYHEVSTESLEKILQLPFEFIITQSFDFCVTAKQLESQQYQVNILEISGDKSFRDLSGIGDFINSDKGLDTDYCKLQNSVTIISNNPQELEKDVAALVEKFGSLGFILVREDVFLEHCFWAQLPANFAFLRRQKTFNTAKIGGFAALYNFPSGSFDNNHWGPAITTFKTILGTAYFFNFHDKDLGHCLVVGSKNSGKTTITNFLVSEAQKFNNKLFYFNNDKSSQVFIEALLGDYHILTKNIDDKNFLQLNPFSLPKNEENSLFLANWIKELVAFLKGDVSEEEIKLIPEVISQVLSQENPSFLAAFDTFKHKAPALYEKLKIWGSGKLAYIFGSVKESDWQNKIHAFDLSEIVNQKPVLFPVVSYLMQRILSCLDGSPSIVVFDNALEFVNNEIIAPKLDDFLQKLRSKNCVAIFIINDSAEIENSQAINTIVKNCAVKIYLANEKANDVYQEKLGLNQDEIEVIKMMNVQDYNAMIKQTGDSVILDLNLEELQEYLKILSSNATAITAMQEIIATQKQKNPQQKIDQKELVLQLKEVLHEFEKEKKDAAIKAAQERKAQEAKNKSQKDE